MSADRESVFEVARTWLSQGERVAWATVVATWSSSPRPLGSQMVIAQGGRFAGSVSGGCVESAVIVAAGELFAGGPAARTLKYGVSTEQAWEVGLPCGGTIEILLCEAALPLLERLLEARDRRESVVRLSDVTSGTEEVWERDQPSRIIGCDEEARAVALAARREQSTLLEVAGRRLFVHVVSAPLRLVIVGAVHLSQAVVDLATLAGIDVTVVDPRAAFATLDRFPGVTLMHDWPDVALPSLGLDRRTAVVVLSHDAKLDEPALVAALRSECFYIGALGSQRTQRARRERLAESGFSDDDLDRVHGPVGLDIGALTTPEIAISIMAQLIRQWRARPEPSLPPAVSTEQ